MDQDRLLKQFCRLVSIDAPSLKERRMADYLKAELEELGFEVEEDGAGDALEGDSGNLYAVLKGTKKSSPLLFSLHMDTVFPAEGKQAVIHEDGRITSNGDTVLGADDMAGMASVLEALRTIVEEGAEHRDVELLISVGEELHLLGSGIFEFEKISAKESYTLDLSGQIGTAAWQAPSLASFAAKISGRSAHAGFAPEKGIHAVAIAARAVNRIDIGRVSEAMTVNIGSISGGTATNVIPDSCIVTGEVRGFSHEAVLGETERIKEIFKEEAKAEGGSISFQYQMPLTAFETPHGHPVVKRFRRACEKLGIQPQMVRTFGGSDQNNLSCHGVTGLVLASAMHQVHSCQEFTEISEMLDVPRLVYEIILDEE